MSFCRLMWLGVVCLAGIAGCSKTPTSPTAAPAPPSAQIIIANPQQSTAASAPPRLTLAPPRAIAVTRLVAFGDSITWGAQSAYDPRFIFATASGGYPERLHAGLNAYHAPQQFVVFNEGVPGEWASDPRTLPRLRTTIVNRQAQAVLLLEGINDLSNGNGVPRTIAGLAQLVEAATSVGVPVVIATMYQTYVSTSPEGSVRTNGASEVPAFNTQIRQLVSGRPNVYLVDLEPVMRNRDYVGNDGIHLTDAGFEVMAASFLTVVENSFPVRGSFQ